MEERPSIDMVFLAISALYGDSNKTEKEKASEWLNNLQKSVHAWSIADELLHLKRDVNSCYFAAQTMRTKIQLCFNELPDEAHNSLKDSLIEHISHINQSTNTIIVTQLCLAIADLALQMTSWPTAPIDLISRFSQSHIWPLLEILKVLPEELDARTLRLGENRRRELVEEFRQCAGTIDQFLKHCSDHYSNNLLENIQIVIKIIRCFSSWVSLGVIPIHDLNENVIIHRAFFVLDLKNETPAGALHDAATDCICSLLQCLEYNNNQQHTLEIFLFQNIVQLEPSYHMSVANEDQEKSINYCRIFTELAESLLEKIVSQSRPKSYHYAVEVLDLVLTCVGHHDYEVAEITFNFWYSLSEELYQREMRETTELFLPYVERLITALCRHCQMEPDHEGLLDEGDDFKIFRAKVSDLIKDVVFVVGTTKCFRQMFYNLQVQNVTWDQSEASLFVMQAMAKTILPEENDVVPKIVTAVLNLNVSAHMAIRHTAVGLLGELSHWIKEHPELLDPILDFLLTFLTQPTGTQMVAASAIRSICMGCNLHMGRHVPYLIQMLQRVDDFSISNDAIVGLLQGVASVISFLPNEQFTLAFREICLVQIEPLCRLLESENTSPTKGSKTDPVHWLDRLSSIFRNVHVQLNDGEEHPCKRVVLEIWPVLSKCFDRYQTNSRVMERCCRCIRFMLRCVSQQVKEILENLVRQIISIYELHGHSCFLYVGSILVDEYASDPNCVQGLLDMLHAFLQPTFTLFQMSQGLRDHPDTVDDFFRLCARFIQRAAIPFLQSSSLNPIIQCGITACLLDHKDANTSVMKFFYDLVNTGMSSKNHPDWNLKQQLVRKILDQFGEQLIGNLIHAIVYCLHSYMLCEVSDVICEMLNFNRDVTGKWLAKGLDNLPKTGINAASPQQLAEIHAKLVKADTSKTVTNILKELTRFYR